MLEYNNFEPNVQKIPYMGGDPVRCPRCSNVVTNRYCDFCNLDLSTVYFKTQAVPPVAPQTHQYTPPNYGQPYNPYMYRYSPAPKKRNVFLTIVIILLVLALCSIPISLISKLFFTELQPRQYRESYMPPNKQEEFSYSSGISAEEYKRLKIGMSYAQISAIIGGDGNLIDSGETLYEEKYYIYAWYGENNPNAVVYITITSDKVSDITLNGDL